MREAIRRYKVGPRNSTVNSNPGCRYDWSLFCWDGSAKSPEQWGDKPFICPLPFVDGFLIAPGCQYIHVPYDFAETGCIFRVRPSYSMYAGRTYRGLFIRAQRAVKLEDGWYWELRGTVAAKG